MTEPTTAEERAKHYLAMAAELEAQADTCNDPVLAESLRKIAREWRALVHRRDPPIG